VRDKLRAGWCRGGSESGGTEGGEGPWEKYTQVGGELPEEGGASKQGASEVSPAVLRKKGIVDRFEDSRGEHGQ
jgi:hypothetical protein